MQAEFKDINLKRKYDSLSETINQDPLLWEQFAAGLFYEPVDLQNSNPEYRTEHIVELHRRNAAHLCPT